MAVISVPVTLGCYWVLCKIFRTVTLHDTCNINDSYDLRHARFSIIPLVDKIDEDHCP